MRVRATQAFAAVRDCQIIELTAGQEVDGDIAAYLLNTGAAVELLDGDPVDIVDELHIDGKIEDVLAWVGDDTDRALAALEAEEAKGDKARPRLLAKLNEI